MSLPPFRATALLAIGLLGTTGATEVARAASEICTDCLRVRVGPAEVVRGPFPDELDATFTALRLADGTLRGFSANGTTYAVDGTSLWDLEGPRRAVLEAGAAGSINDCGRWLTSVSRAGDHLLGFVHQEADCDYDEGRTGKSMAIASSTDDGLTWTDLGTVITGTDTPQPGTITGEGDCSMIDGMDGYLYAYCLRNSDWQTIVARALIGAPTDWYKYHAGAWNEPGLGGEATAIGFLGPGGGYISEPGWVATVATDPWFGGVRLSLSDDKVTFVDLDEPLVAIDGAEWDRPAETGLVAYGTIIDPETGSNQVGWQFLLSYIYVPPGEGFESRYLVHQEVSLSLEDTPQAVQVGTALTRWFDAEQNIYVTSTGPLTGDRRDFSRDVVVAHLLTAAPEGVASIKIAECSSDWPGHLDQLIADEGSCEPAGYVRERTAGWLFATEQPDSVPVYRCVATEAATHFASSAMDCEGLGTREFLLGYGLAP